MAEPTAGQRRLILGLFAFAFLVFVTGIVVIAYLSGVI
ncbi:hypothetical protein C499_07855 [Halogeometricum borinquense DSM 11551]|uniref:Uncharacterized protein n=1 Tax=Halogeometricum borinquense (strain ATCC 700274 / DSM 11551 / JCM 10706 / KCTC 4070 / PR3) TaxID=469382 RepID=E4NMT5_HALBP|nr:hypothetical protein Hbor_17790 [Halogeometricum borinquense DSM 11551]ELY28560.1 hypothetical protein C499_07855 [Halogeometricum borinquense DSM 11551]